MMPSIQRRTNIRLVADDQEIGWLTNRGSLALVIGGPGTGKTLLAQTIVREAVSGSLLRVLYVGRAEDVSKLENSFPDHSRNTLRTLISFNMSAAPSMATIDENDIEEALNSEVDLVVLEEVHRIPIQGALDRALERGVRVVLCLQQPSLLSGSIERWVEDHAAVVAVDRGRIKETAWLVAEARGVDVASIESDLLASVELEIHEYDRPRSCRLALIHPLPPWRGARAIEWQRGRWNKFVPVEDRSAIGRTMHWIRVPMSVASRKMKKRLAHSALR